MAESKDAPEQLISILITFIIYPFPEWQLSRTLTSTSSLFSCHPSAARRVTVERPVSLRHRDCHESRQTQTYSERGSGHRLSRVPADLVNERSCSHWIFMASGENGMLGHRRNWCFHSAKHTLERFAAHVLRGNSKLGMKLNAQCGRSHFHSQYEWFNVKAYHLNDSQVWTSSRPAGTGLNSHHPSDWTTCHRRCFCHQMWTKDAMLAKSKVGTSLKIRHARNYSRRRVHYSGLDTQTQQHCAEYISGPAAAPVGSSALAWSFVSCFHLIIFFHYSAKHIGHGCDTADLSLQPSRAKPGRWNISRLSIVGNFLVWNQIISKKMLIWTFFFKRTQLALNFLSLTHHRFLTGIPHFWTIEHTFT